MPIGICQNTTAAMARQAAVSVSLYDSIAAVPERDWLRFVSDSNPLLQPSYLRLLEDTKRGDMEFIYALLHSEGSLVGVCYFQVVRFTGTNLVPYFPTITGTSFVDRIKRFGINIGKSLVARVDLRLLVSGNLYITGEQGIYFLPTVTELEKSHYLAYAIQQIFRQRNYIKAALLPDMYEPSGDFDDAYLHGSYNRIYVEADMSMTLPNTWHSFDDYLAAISSKYRVRAKKILQTSAPIEGHEMDAPEIESQLDRLYELYKIVAEKADFNIAKFPASYFLEQKRLSPDIYKVFGYYLDGRLVGFMSMFILPHKAEVHYCGIDYSINKELNLYQRMLYDTVGYAAQHGLRRLHFGRTAPEVKSTIGAIPHPMYGYLRIKNGIVNRIAGIFTSRLKPREYILRSPFK